MLITRMFIKRCIYKYQARIITWQVQVKYKNSSENFVRIITYFKCLIQKKKLLNDVKEKVIAQEKLELDLFKDVTIPDLREKEGKKGKSGSAEDPKKPGKIPLTLLNIKEIQAMFAYEADYELLDKVAMSRPPNFGFVQPSREVIDRLIVRASMEKEFY